MHSSLPRRRGGRPVDRDPVARVPVGDGVRARLDSGPTRLPTRPGFGLRTTPGQGRAAHGGRLGPRPRHPPTGRRRILRSARPAFGFDARDPGTRRRVPIRHGQRREHARLRHSRERRTRRPDADALEARAGKRPPHGTGVLVVVRRPDRSVSRARRNGQPRRSSVVAPSPRSIPSTPRSASAAELDDLRRRIVAQPDQWVGQERLTPASTPVLGTDRIEPRPTVLRSFVVPCGDSYVAMPGGLARTGLRRCRRTDHEPNGRHLEGHLGAGKRLGTTDRVLTVRAVPCRSGNRRGLYRARAAENLFWFGRYAERAEATVRLIRAVTTRCDEFLNVETGPGPASITVLLEALTHITGTYPGFVGDDTGLARRSDDELIALVVDDRRRGTVAHAVRHMFDALDVVRDQLSVDTWLVVGSLQRELQRLEGGQRGDCRRRCRGTRRCSDGRAERTAPGAAVAVRSGKRVDGAEISVGTSWSRSTHRTWRPRRDARRVDVGDRAQRTGREPRRRVRSDRRREHHHLASPIPDRAPFVRPPSSCCW